MIELAIHSSLLIKPVTTNIAFMIIIILVWYMFQASPIAGVNLFGSYTFGNLYWLATGAMIGTILFDIGQEFAPSIGSLARERYKGKRVLDWNELAKAMTSIAVLITMWWAIFLPARSLAYALGSWTDPTVVLGSYHALFLLAVAYYAVSGVIRSKAARFQQPEALREVSWDGIEEAVRVSGYLKRLEALKSSGNIDDRTYDKLRMEYETKLRGAIELP